MCGSNTMFPDVTLSHESPLLFEKEYRSRRAGLTYVNTKPLKLPQLDRGKLKGDLVAPKRRQYFPKPFVRVGDLRGFRLCLTAVSSIIRSVYRFLVKQHQSQAAGYPFPELMDSRKPQQVQILHWSIREFRCLHQ